MMKRVLFCIALSQSLIFGFTSRALAVTVQKDFKAALVQAYPACNPSCSTTPLSDWTFDGATVRFHKPNDQLRYDFELRITGLRNEGSSLCAAGASESVTLKYKVDATSADGSTRDTDSFTRGPYPCDDGEININNWYGGGVVAIGDGSYEVYDIEVWDSDGDLLAVPGFRR